MVSTRRSVLLASRINRLACEYQPATLSIRNLHDYPFTPGPTLPSAVTSDKPHSSPARSRSAISRDPSYVPRPRNAFMLFRIEFNARKQRHQGNLTRKDVSQLAGACWRELLESRKQVYRDMASKERDFHMAKHPSYTYRYNDERNLLRKPASAPGQLRNSTKPKTVVGRLTDRGLTPALLSGSIFNSSQRAAQRFSSSSRIVFS